MTLTLETCCGYTAALIACVAFGSFAVPIKHDKLRSVPVDPLVLQTYKILMCFVTSFAVLSVTPFVWTPWGIVSGLVMVPGGTAGYYSVRSAGLAVSQGVWSSLKVLVAFLWGLIIFHEPVHSVVGSLVAVALLITGLAGMSWFARPTYDRSLVSDLTTPLLPDLEGSADEMEQDDACGCLDGSSRTWGLLGAVVDGLYGGSILVPMHYSGVSGLAFLPSFAIGCTITVGMTWLIRWGLSVSSSSSLPSMHLGTVGPYAALAGLIWSVGNLASLVAVDILGQAIGYSLVQSQLLIAGLWGLLYYKEVKSVRSIVAWFVFCLLTVVGIILLSLQHEGQMLEESADSGESHQAGSTFIASLMMHP